MENRKDDECRLSSLKKSYSHKKSVSPTANDIVHSSEDTRDIIWARALGRQKKCLTW